MSMRNIHAILMCLLGFATMATAQSLRTVNLSYEALYNPPAKDYLAANLIPLKFDGRFKVWYLMGEPVINCTARWLNNHQLRVNTPGGDTIIAPAGETEVYNLMLVAQMGEPGADNKPIGQRGGHIAAFCDAGIVAQNNNDGFNVAGSPNWDKFLCRLPSKFNIVETAIPHFDTKQDDPCLSIGGDWLSAADAKKMAREGLEFKDVRVKSAEIYTGEAIRNYEKLMWRKKSFAYKENKARALDRTYSQRANGGITVFGARIGQFHGKSAYPTAADLKAYDALISEIQGKLRDGGAFAAEWRKKDEALVRNQLEHVKTIDHQLRAQSAEQEAYRQELERMRDSYLKNGRYALLGAKPEQDAASKRWGYRVEGEETWVIKPTYLSATNFNESGEAEVLVDRQFISREPRRSVRYCGQRGTRETTWDQLNYLKTYATINFQGEQLNTRTEKDSDNENWIYSACREK